jgi:hypothetical protein
VSTRTWFYVLLGCILLATVIALAILNEWISG